MSIIVVKVHGSIVPISAEFLHIRRDDGDSKYFHHIIYYFSRPYDLINARRIKQDGCSAGILSSVPDPDRLRTIEHRMWMIKSVPSPEVKRLLA